MLLQQCPACLVRLTWIVFVMGGRWPYSWCLVECWCQDLFNIQPSAWKKLRFILSVWFDFHMIESLSISVHAFVSRVSMSFSVDETLLKLLSNCIASLSASGNGSLSDSKSPMYHTDPWPSRQSEIIRLGRTCENKWKQLHGWTEMCRCYDMIYVYAHVK